MYHFLTRKLSLGRLSTPPVWCHMSSCTLRYYNSLQQSWPRSLPLNPVPYYMHPAANSVNSTSATSGLLYSAQICTEDDHSRTKFPACKTKSGETYCFDSSFKPTLINYSVLKCCSGLINLIKSLHWASIKSWIHLHDFNIPHTSLGIFCFEENITLQQNGEQYHC